MIYKKVDKETAQGLKVLRQRIQDSQVPSSEVDQRILVASWNIREFGKQKRQQKAVHYIAEILSYFDLIAIQELRGDLGDLKRVLDVLEPYWRVLYSDVTEGRYGNQERIAFLYDKRVVTFNGLAAEAVAAPVKGAQGKLVPAPQFWRTPYMASFRAGTFDFVLLAVHVMWGEGEDERLVELKQLAEWVKARRASKFAEDKDIILMGDFNIPKRGDKLYKAFSDVGMVAPKPILDIVGGSNLSRNKDYDQIFYFPQETKGFANKGGVLDFYAGDHKPLIKGISKDDFTYQLSDHLPIWVEVQTDTAEEELDQIIRGGD